MLQESPMAHGSATGQGQVRRDGGEEVPAGPVSWSQDSQESSRLQGFKRSSAAYRFLYFVVQ